MLENPREMYVLEVSDEQIRRSQLAKLHYQTRQAGTVASRCTSSNPHAMTELENSLLDVMTE
jgi:hypothetical protein